MKPLTEPAHYKHEVHYARWWAYLALFAGLMALPAAVICAFWLRSWGLPLFLVGAGIAAIASAYGRLSNAGPQVKFGPEGIWTEKLGFLPWRKVRADVGRPPGTMPGASVHATAYVLVYERITGQLLDQLEALPLDMELDLLGGYLRYYSNLK